MALASSSGMPALIVVGVDFSPCSAAALEHARLIARAENARLLIVHVITPSEMESAEKLAAKAAVHGQDPDEFALTRAERELVHFAGRPGGATEEEHVVDVGDPADGILRAAKERHASTVVVGTTGRGRLEHLLLGSVASRVMKEASCSVIAVHCRRAAE